MADGVRLPGAIWKPFTNRSVSSTPWIGPLTVILHTIVGSRNSAWNTHNQPGKPYVQLYYDNLGIPFQTTGLQFKAAGTLELNPYVVAIENADYGPGFPQWNLQCGNVPPFTEEQVKALIRDITWMFLRFGGEPVMMGESCLPLGGIGYHRLSIDPWRKAGCLEGSTSTGKCCPDSARIGQIVNRIQPEVARLVRLARNPQPTPTLIGDTMSSFFYRTAGKEWRLYDNGTIIDLPYETSGSLANSFIGLIDQAHKHTTGSTRIVKRFDGIPAILYEYITAAGQSKRDEAPGFVAKINETGKRAWVTADRSGKISEEVNPDEFAAIVWVVTKNGFDLTPQPYAAVQLKDIPELTS